MKLFYKNHILIPSIIAVILMATSIEWYILNNKKPTKANVPESPEKKAVLTIHQNNLSSQKLMETFKASIPNAQIKKHGYIDLNGNNNEELIVLYSLEQVIENKKVNVSNIAVLAEYKGNIKTILNKEIGPSFKEPQADFKFSKSPVLNNLKVVDVEYLTQSASLLKSNILIGFDGEETRVLLENTTPYIQRYLPKLVDSENLVDIDKDGLCEFISYHALPSDPKSYWRNSFKWNSDSKSFVKFKKELIKEGKWIEPTDKDYILDENDFYIKVKDNYINLSTKLKTVKEILGKPKKENKLQKGYYGNPMIYEYKDFSFLADGEDIYEIRITGFSEGTSRGVMIGNHISKIMSTYGPAYFSQKNNNEETITYDIENSKKITVRQYLKLNLKDKYITSIQIGEYME